MVWVSRWTAASLSRLSTTWRPTMPSWQAIHLSWRIYDRVSKVNAVGCQAWLPIYFLPFLLRATYTICLHQFGHPNINCWIEQVTREIVFTHMSLLGYQKCLLFGALHAVFLVNMTVTFERIKSDLRLSAVGLITKMKLWIRIVTYFSVHLYTCALTLLVQCCKKNCEEKIG